MVRVNVQLVCIWDDDEDKDEKEYDEYEDDWLVVWNMFYFPIYWE